MGASHFFDKQRQRLTDPQTQRLAKKLNIPFYQVQRANHELMLHSARLLGMLGRSRPEVAKHLALNSSVAWADFGDRPLAAWYDPAKQAVTLNMEHFLSRPDGIESAKRTLTHEWSHIVDEKLGGGKSVFTDAFKPFHQWMSKQQPQAWWMETRMAYPSTGFYGSASNVTSSLSEEYIAIFSELFWHRPADFARVERLAKEGGYEGPPLRDVMSGIWGGMPILPEPETVDIPASWRRPFDGRALGIAKPKGVVRWKSGTEAESWQSHLL